MPLQLIFSIGLIFVFLVVIVAIAEKLNQIITDDKELTRKVVHIGIGNVILLAWWLQIPTVIGIAAATIAATMNFIAYFIPILPSINSVGRRSFGTFFYAISIGVLIAWFWPQHLPQYTAIGILIMAWGDGMAAIMGQRFGQHTYQVLGITKSWEGSLAMAGASFLVTWPILFSLEGNIWHSGFVAAIVALVAASLEAFSKLGIDNLTVPIGSAAIAFYLTQSSFF